MSRRRVTAAHRAVGGRHGARDLPPAVVAALGLYGVETVATIGELAAHRLVAVPVPHAANPARDGCAGCHRLAVVLALWLARIDPDAAALVLAEPDPPAAHVERWARAWLPPPPPGLVAAARGLYA